jgi:acetyl esterase
MPLDPHVRAFLAEHGARLAFPAGARTDRGRGDRFLAEVRPLLNPPAVAPAEPVEQVHDESTHCAGRVRVYRGSSEPGQAVITYLHGGGWVSGGLEMNDPLCRRLAALTGCVVVSVDYRLAPEHPYPAALGDTLNAILWTRQNAERLGGDPARVAIAGTSAGANIAAGACLLSRDIGLEPLQLQLLVYPVLDLPSDTPSYVRNGSGYLLEREQMEWYWDQYLPHRERQVPVYAAPGRAADLSGLPPAIVVSAEYDPLRDEAEAYATRLEAAGVATVSLRCAGMIHGFLSFLGLIPAADDAVRTIGDATAAMLRTTMSV